MIGNHKNSNEIERKNNEGDHKRASKRQAMELDDMLQSTDRDEASNDDAVNLRPKTMFAMKGRARPSDNATESYLPQWSKDGEGFKRQATLIDDKDRRKGKGI